MEPAWIEFPARVHGGPKVRCKVVILARGETHSRIRYIEDCAAAKAGDERSAPNHVLTPREDL